MNSTGYLSKYASECISEYGNPDVTGIGVRCTTYISVGSLLVFLIIGDRKRSWINGAVIFAMISTLVNQGIAFWFLFHGKLDQYISTVMLHGTLLVNAAHVLHLLKFQRRKEHRCAFGLNTLLSAVHFIMTCLPTSIWQGDRNLNYCAELHDAIDDCRKQRITYTVGSLVLSILLTLTDFIVRKIDAIRNPRQPDRKNGEHSVRTFPEWLTWNAKDPWNLRRALYCICAALWFFYSIFQLEYFVIRGFRTYIAGLDGITTKENEWAIGQLMTIFAAGAVSLVTIRNYAQQNIATKRRKASNEKRKAEKREKDFQLRQLPQGNETVVSMEMQPCGVGPSKGGETSTAWNTTGWRVDSDAEVKTRMSRSGEEVPNGEIKTHDLVVPSGKKTGDGGIGRTFSVPKAKVPEMSRSLEKARRNGSV